MARKEGLRPIGDSVKKIIEKIQKERRERLKKGKPIRTQPKLPGLKKGGSAKKPIQVKKIAIGIGKIKDYPGIKKIILSVGSANAANFFCLGVLGIIPPSANLFLPFLFISIIFFIPG